MATLANAFLVDCPLLSNQNSKQWDDCWVTDKYSEVEHLLRQEPTCDVYNSQLASHSYPTWVFDDGSKIIYVDVYFFECFVEGY